MMAPSWALSRPTWRRTKGIGCGSTVQLWAPLRPIWRQWPQWPKMLVVVAKVMAGTATIEVMAAAEAAAVNILAAAAEMVAASVKAGLWRRRQIAYRYK